MNHERRNLANLLNADLSTWYAGGTAIALDTGEVLDLPAQLSVWCEWVPRVILASRWPDKAREVAVYWDVMERIELYEGRPLHARVYTYEEVFGERGVMHLAVVADLWDDDALSAFCAWALDHLYRRYTELTGEIHRCQGRAAVLEHQLNIAAAIAA